MNKNVIYWVSKIQHFIQIKENKGSLFSKRMNEEQERRMSFEAQTANADFIW